MRVHVQPATRAVAASAAGDGALRPADVAPRSSLAVIIAVKYSVDTPIRQSRRVATTLRLSST